MININDTYLYLINLDDNISCHNFALLGALQSTLFIDIVHFNRISNLYKIDTEELKLDADTHLQGISSPCGFEIVHASWIRKKVPLFDGHLNPISLSEEQKERILFKADMEIHLEKVRRLYYPTLPSRITSFYLADNNNEGRLTLQNIFGGRVSRGEIRPQIMSVRIKHLSASHSADIRWLDEYKENPIESHLHSYWKGTILDQYPRVEHIIEGQIYPSDSDDINNIRENGKLFEVSRSYFLNLDELDFTSGNWLDPGFKR